MISLGIPFLVVLMLGKAKVPFQQSRVYYIVSSYRGISMGWIHLRHIFLYRVGGGCRDEFCSVLVAFANRSLRNTLARKWAKARKHAPHLSDTLDRLSSPSGMFKHHHVQTMYHSGANKAFEKPWLGSQGLALGVNTTTSGDVVKWKRLMGR